MISSYDPMRREIGVLALQQLIQDGRIHPGRIEEAAEWARKEVERKVREYGRVAMEQAGIRQMHEELIRKMGELAFRTSYGQNLLHHSVETALIAAHLAGELGLNVEVARRAGFLHDVGKAVESEETRSHALVGAEFAKRCGESEQVVHAIAAHHEEVPVQYPEDILVMTADAISAVRPGARKESLEKYLERVRQLEEIAYSFGGVKQAYAISAGRELRVFVEPDEVSDADMLRLAREIAKRITTQMKTPVPIRVTVIRERRVVEVAR